MFGLASFTPQVRRLTFSTTNRSRLIEYQLVFYPLFRIVNAESVVHYGLRCASCRTENFRGLKYKSDRSPNYQLCQACFWCGHISSEHKNDVFKEYNTYKPTSGRSTTPLSSGSLKKSINCLQGGVGGGSGSKKGSKKVPKYPDHPDKPMDLSNMVRF